MAERIKIGLISSRGGHLFQLYQLKDWWKRYPRFWVTDRGEDSDYLLRNEKAYYGYFPESRNLFNAIRNFFLAFKILRKEKPNLLVSCGAGIAPPFFYVGKILGCKLIFIETFTFVKRPTLSGKIIYPIANLFLIQHKDLKKFYPKAKYWGRILF